MVLQDSIGLALLEVIGVNRIKNMAERLGFEPRVLVKVHTLSKRAP